MDTSDEETFASQFGSLDELIQLIYQGTCKFVVLSTVTDTAGWVVHLGLTGTSGRWWKGRWTENDFKEFVGHKTSSKLVDTFAEHLAKAFVQGELYVTNWSPERGAEISLTVGTSAKTPVQIPLKELTHQDAAVYAATVFADIASQARERQCKLNPPPYQVYSNVVSPQPSVPPTEPISSKRKTMDEESAASVQKSPARKAKPRTVEHNTNDEAEAKIKELEAELVHAQQEAKAAKRPVTAETAKSTNKGLASKAKSPTAPALRPAKGASLANPNKKARKYQALEFDDD